MTVDYDPAVADVASYERLETALADVAPPFAVVDLDALRANAADLVRRAAGKPIRLASKSVRCRALMRRIVAEDERDSERGGFRGLMTFTLRESLWLLDDGFDDLLLAYPTVDHKALAELGERAPMLMIDSVEQLDLIDAAAPARARPVRVCLDFDTSLELAGGRVRIGPKRSPLRTPDDAAALARAVVARPGVELAGVMGYEGHVAGVGDRPPNPLLGAGLRAMQRAAIAQLAERRAAVVAAVREIAPVALVNGGGTGSLESTAAEPAVTEVTAGSGLFGPALFDHYRAFHPRPAALFCAAGRAPAGRRHRHRPRRRLPGVRAGRTRPPAEALSPARAAADRARGRRRGSDAADRARRRRAAPRRPRLPPAREGRRAVRALQHAVSARRRPRASTRCRRIAARAGRSCSGPRLGPW